MKYLICFFAGLLMVPANGAGTVTGPFRYTQSVTGELRGKSLGSVSLEPEVFRETQTHFRDLRLIHEQDGIAVEVPYLLVPREVKGPVRAQRIPATVEQFDQQEDGSLVVVIKLEKEARAAAEVRVESELRDFEKNVRIEGSIDGESWEELVGGALIFDYARFIDFRRTTVKLPENMYRWFRVRIEGATDRQLSLTSTLRRQVSESSGVTVERSQTETKRPFRIEGLGFFTLTEEKGDEEKSLRTYPVELTESRENEERKQSEILLKTDGAPLIDLVLETGETNFRREVELQVPVEGEKDAWRTIRKSEIFRYEIDDFKEEQLLVAVSESADGLRSRQLRLLVHRGDNRPVKISGVRGEGRIHDLFFMSPAGGALKLFYGAADESVEKPAYDVAAIRIGMRRKMASLPFETGEVLENPDYLEAKMPVQWSEQRWILWIVVALIVAGLTWILMSSARLVEKANVE